LTEGGTLQLFQQRNRLDPITHLMENKKGVDIVVVDVDGLRKRDGLDGDRVLSYAPLMSAQPRARR